MSSSIGAGLMLAAAKNRMDKIDTKKNANNDDKSSGTSKHDTKRLLLSLFEINVIRYSLFLENVRPESVKN